MVFAYPNKNWLLQFIYCKIRANYQNVRFPSSNYFFTHITVVYFATNVAIPATYVVVN